MFTLVPIPNGAAGAIARYLDAVDRAIPDFVVALYVTGSLALGDYHADRSDIDVVTVVNGAPDAAQRSLLAEVLGGGPPRSGAPWVRVAAWASPPAAIGPVAFHVNGRFEF